MTTQIQYQGKTLTLKQDAYLSNNSNVLAENHYRAEAVDEAGNEYIIRWEMTDAYLAAEAAYQADPENVPPQEDESEACNWDEFAVRAL